MAESAWLPGEVFAEKYRITRVLGEGGMGVVVGARHLQLDEDVAIKFMRPEVTANAAAAERFLREARASAKIKSEHVARVYDVGTHDGVLFMVMEQLEGRDLAQVVQSSGPLPPEVAVDYTLQACQALAEAHSRGIVHRDLKPENLFLTHRANGTPCVKVLDFGISKVVATEDVQRMTSTSALMGSPMYMSPEQLATPREVDMRTDVWSMGVVLYELLTGRHPFEAETLPQLCIQIREAPPVSLRLVRPEVPAALEEIVTKCLEKDPAKRFGSFDELATALEAFAPAMPRSSARRLSAPVEHEVARPATSSPPGARTDMTWGDGTPKSSRRFALPLVAIVVVALGGGAAALLTTKAPPRPSVEVAPPIASAPQAPASNASVTPLGALDPLPTVSVPSATAQDVPDAHAPAGAAPSRGRTGPAGGTRKADPRAGASGGVLPVPPDDRK